MDFYEGTNGALGEYPKYGAIFLSNPTTKKECFKRKLFGLPPGQADFVKQIKTGMMLFLFDFERRTLYGVFQACSDGAMNIVPNAFSSAGHFPAQVKFIPIWLCDPLYEEEFCDAIKENYFSPKKFNFGLSSDQVRRLLSLFSVKKLKDQPPQKHLSRNQVARTSGHPRHRSKKRGDRDTSFTYRVEDRHSLNNSEGAVISRNDYSRNSFRDKGIYSKGHWSEDGIKMKGKFHSPISNEYVGKVSRELDDTRHASPANVGNDVNIERGRMSASVNYPWHTSPEIPRDLDQFKFEISDLEYNKKHFSGKPVSFDLTSNLPSNLDRSPGYRSSTLTTNYLADDHNLGPCTVHHTINAQVGNLPHLTAYGDETTGVSNFSRPILYGNAPTYPNSFGPYPAKYGDAIPATLKHSYLPSYGGNSFPGHPDGHDINHPSQIALGIDNSSRLTEEWNTSQKNYVSDILEDEYIPLPYASYEEPYGVPEPTYLENMLKICNEEGLTGPFSGDCILPYQPYPENGNGGRTDKESIYFPRFDHNYNMASQCEDDYVKLGSRNNDLVANAQRAKDAHRSSLKRRGSNDHEMMNDHIDQNSERFHSSAQKKRNSVFSRLAKAPQDQEREKVSRVENYECNVEISVDELMAKLNQNHREWLNNECPRPSLKRKDRVANLSKKNQTRFDLVSSDNHLQLKISKSIKTNTMPADEGAENPVEKIPFVDFKRRSKEIKTHERGKNEGSARGGEDADGTLGGHHKKRKLIRPSFVKNESLDDKFLDKKEILDRLESGSDTNINTYIVLPRDMDNKPEVSQNVSVSESLCQIIQKDRDVEAGKHLPIQGNRQLENCGASLKFNCADAVVSYPSESCEVDIQDGEGDTIVSDSVPQELSLDMKDVKSKKETLCVGLNRTDRGVLQDIEVTLDAVVSYPSESCEVDIQDGEGDTIVSDSVPQELSLDMKDVKSKKETLCVGLDRTDRGVLQDFEVTPELGTNSDEGAPNNNIGILISQNSEADNVCNEPLGALLNEEEAGNKPETVVNIEESTMAEPEYLRGICANNAQKR